MGISMALHPGWSRRLVFSLASLLFTPCLHATSRSIETIFVDASKVTGTIKRLNDVDNGPLCQHGTVDLSRYYKELGVRNVRLHDVSWSYADVLDIENLFPDWNADADLPESYHFTQSDLYIKSITDLGINIIFRLGYSAEAKSPIRHNTPPPSYDKWVAVVEHIVRHYNQGWANGPHANIKYWEIWNEPDLPDFWSGTPEQYYRLYEVTAMALKKLDSSLYVGGPAVATDRPFLDGFFQYAKQHKLPIDFVSWHIYTQNPDDVVARGEKMHSLMVQYGYADAQSILDEWNYGPSNWDTLFSDAEATRSYFDATQSSIGAAFDAAVLISLQDAHVDIATFYTGTTAMWGLFTPSGSPQKPFYAFLAFSNLLNSPKRLAVTTPTDSAIRTLAGISEDGQTIRILISNPSPELHQLHIALSGLPWKAPAEYQRQAVDDESNLKIVGGWTKLDAATSTEDVAGHSAVLLTIRPQVK
jgi:xylan 1,4-beta-xylosidase